VIQKSLNQNTGNNYFFEKNIKTKFMVYKMKKPILGFLLLIPVILAAVFFVRNAYVKKETWPPIETIPAGRQIKIIIATDIHYLAPELLDPRSSFHRELERGDGKMPHYSAQIMAAFLDEAIRMKPAAILLLGDLTFNGEKSSHIELAGLFSKAREAGIPVLAIPGNHDINSPQAYQFLDRGHRRVPNITPQEFWKLYSPLGATGAVSFDNSSLSYVYQLSEDLQIMMLDTSQYNNGRVEASGRINEGTLIWMEKNLAKAKKSGIHVITVTHHSLLSHSDLFTSGFTIENYQQAAGILEEYGVSLNLSGHIHIQHIKRANETGGIYDIATGSLIVYPNYYGIIDINADKSISYTAHKVNVAEFAEANKIDDENLLNFDEYSFGYMSQTAFSRIRERLARYNISDEQKTAMVEFAAMLNVHYFAGLPLAITEEDTMSKLWREYFPSGFHTRYLDSILNDSGSQHTMLFIPPPVRNEE
jgi:predicted MPP superfamily phosphohydrolase